VRDGLDPHFFRHEWGRLVAVLVRIFGVHNLTLAEDVAQDSLWRAMQVWKETGLPEEPSAWLTTVAKRRVIQELRRDRTRRMAAPELARLLESEWTRVPAIEELFSPPAVRDDPLRMMFSLAQTRLPEASRVGLVLNVLCGFSEEEVAAAFLTTKEAMAKRLQRAKGIVANSRSLFELTDADLPARLESVQSALYLLFGEGYHGASAEATIRANLCAEAMRLVDLLVAHPLTATPSTLALAALTRLHAARLASRTDEAGALLPLHEQDRAKWDAELIQDGLRLLERSAVGESVSAFHVEAAIAACHATSKRADDTPWAQIASLYDTLFGLRPSPVVALSRAIALGKCHGPERGLRALDEIADPDVLARYPFYPAARGEFSLALGRSREAAQHFAAALRLARNPNERAFFERRLAAVRAGPV
jgi:RNA polymerase sigma-70 factor (ECF subfamily)